MTDVSGQGPSWVPCHYRQAKEGLPMRLLSLWGGIVCAIATAGLVYAGGGRLNSLPVILLLFIILAPGIFALGQSLYSIRRAPIAAYCRAADGRWGLRRKSSPETTLRIVKLKAIKRLTATSLLVRVSRHRSYIVYFVSADLCSRIYEDGMCAQGFNPR